MTAMQSETLNSVISSMKFFLALEDESEDKNSLHSSENTSQHNQQCIKKGDHKVCRCHNKIFHPLTKSWEERLSKVKCHKNTICNQDIQWQFVDDCLELLLKIKAALINIETSSMNINPLGVNDSKIVCSITELIIVLGVFPNLYSGIGLPLKTKFANLVPPSDVVEERKLYKCIEILLDIMEVDFIKNILFTRVVNDLLAGLIQLVYCPRKEKDNSCCCCYPDTRCFSCGILTIPEIEWCRTMLENLLNTTYQPMVVKHLFILQRSGPAGVRPDYKWFSNALGKLISQRLLQKGGLKAVIAGILDGCDRDSLNWERYTFIGKILAHVPQQVMSVQDYYMEIGKQVTEFLVCRSEKEIYPFIAISLACFNHMLAKREKLCLKFTVKEVLTHLLSEQQSACKNISINEDTFSKVLNFMEQIYSNPNFEITAGLQNVFTKISFILFSINASKCFNITSFKNQLSFVLISLLNKISDIEALRLVFKWMFSYDEEMIIHISNEISINTQEIPFDFKIRALLNLLKDSRLENIRSIIFIKLLEMISNSKKICRNEDNQPLLELDTTISDIAEQIQLASLVSALMDEFGHSVLQNTQQIIAFIKYILESKLQMQETDDLESLDISKSNEDNINLALMLLSTLLGTDKLTTADFDILHSLTSALDKISRTHSDRSTRKLATDLTVYISTRGAVKPTGTQSSTKDNQSYAGDVNSEDVYLAAMKDLTDPLLPTRGHALITLAKLIQNRNKYALQDHEKLLEIFQVNMASDDSYLYLASIDGLTSLADIHHGTILPLLCKKFSCFHKDSNASGELRMKLSEAIVKSCRLCGDMLPAYKSVIMPSLLVGVKDDNAMIRACSLSALGDVCVLLNYSIKTCIAEIMNCVYHVVKTDQSDQVRRAAVQFFALLFRGMETKLFEIISNEIRDIYRLLKMTLENDNDDVTRFHADNAITILNDVIKNQITMSNSKLKKKLKSCHKQL